MTTVENNHPRKLSPLADKQGSIKVRSVQFQNNKDRYVGDIDPVTKRRNGNGVYTYENAFFQYHGSFVNGVKHGMGTLIMKDGSRFDGQFNEGEISGKGKKTYSDGTTYTGDWINGEKHGYGEIVYGNSKKDQWYKGEWNMNTRQGYGQLKTCDGKLYKGEFRAHQPNGQCKIEFDDGSYFSGNLVNGVIDGLGEMQSSKGYNYSGQFVDNKMHGEGTYSIKEGTFQYRGKFQNNQPVVQANETLWQLVSPLPEVEEVDPKKKADPKKKQVEEEEIDNPMRIVYEVKRENESKKLSFSLTVVYQGPEYEDPNQPDEEEVKKTAAAAKKKGQPEEPEIRMIKPDPETMVTENGRLFEFELGRTEDVAKEGITEEEIAEYKENPDAANKEHSDLYEKKWIQYAMHQNDDTDGLCFREPSIEGVCNVKDLVYELNDKFTGGEYEIIIRDVTKGISNKMPEMRASMKIVDKDAEEAALLQQQQNPKGGKKK